MIIAANTIIISTIFALNYFYQMNGFDFTLKCVSSGCFLLLGIINLCYALLIKPQDKWFSIGMILGLFFSFLGDVLIDSDFILGAVTFAVGHICFTAAYCFLQRLNKMDWFICGLLALGSVSFLMFYPRLHFGRPPIKLICVIYAMLISFMLGKSISNYIKERDIVTCTIMFASALFFFSDLMLALGRFIGRLHWTGKACMGTYYPALCIMALSILLQSKLGE